MLIAIALVIGGVYAVLNINQELTPDMNLPLVTVIAMQPGAGPQDIANEVSAPLEAAIANVAGLKRLQSVSAESFSIVIAHFDFGHDMKAAEREITQSVSDAQLPADVGTPQVMRIDINQLLPVVYLSLGGDIGAEELERIARQELVPSIEAINGVQSVDIIGGVTRQVAVVLDPQKMRESGVTMQQVTGVLQANNISIPSGAVVTDDSVLPVRTVSQLTSLSQIEEMVVGFQVQEGQPPRPIQIKDIASVQISPSPTGSISRTNSKPSVGISVTKTQQGNTVRVANAVEQVARDVQEKLGDRVEIVTILDQSDYIEESIAGVSREGVAGAAAAVIAIWLFLLSFRSAIVAGVSIPFSVVVAVLVLYFQGLTLNILTLGGLAIAVGRVVDDSIVVLENIFRHVQEGDDLNKAVLNGTRQVATAIFGSTMTTIAVFLPLGFAGGIVGLLFRPFALTVTYALLASLVVALTVVPILARFFIGRLQLGRHREPAQQQTVLQRGYTPILGWALQHRVWTLVIAAALFVGSFALLPLIPTTFFPQQGEKMFTANVSLPPGAGSPEKTIAKVLEAEQVIDGLPGVDMYNTSIALGGGDDMMALERAMMGQSISGASIIVILSPDADLEAAKEMARERLGNLEGVLTSIGGGGPEDMNSQLEVSVTGQDLELVQAAALQILDEVRDIDGVRDVSSVTGVSQPELAINVDPQKALAVGLTGAQVALLVRELMVGQTVTRVHLDGDESLDLVVQADPNQVANLDALLNLPVGSPLAVPLSSIATIDQTLAPAQLTRLDQRPSATVSGTITAANTGEVTSEVERRINGLDLPAGIDVEYGGVLEMFQESFNTLYVGIGAAIIIVYIVMVLVMGSLLSPFVIMFTLPLASIGALAALAITGRALGISSLFGILMLVGILVTNGIVLIDFVNQLRDQGYGIYEALMEGGRLRLRPVLMTAVTTILALTPLSLGLTEGAIVAAELATVVIGGLITSTLLTLVVVPVVYSIFEGWRERVSGGPTRGASSIDAS